MTLKRKLYVLGVTVVLFLSLGTLRAEVFVQRPPDTDNIDTDGDDINDNDHVFLHMTGGDGFVNMADGRLMYMFGFADATDTNDANVMEELMLGAEFPGPTIVVKEGQKLYLTLTNVGMVVRPDLFDPHTIHWHGFPQAAPIFDGVPDASISVNMGASLTYFYDVVEPGTYMWHCHVEATEHMEMGMLAQIYVEPIQNSILENNDPLPQHPNVEHTVGDKYVYNDGDGSTYYDIEYPLQLSGFDPDFHDASLLVQPLPFANMDDKYGMINGRGYPESVDPNVLFNTASDEGFTNRPSQKINALVTANQGDRVLLRISSLSTIDYFTVTVLGIPMKVVGTGARLLRGPDGKDLYYETGSVTLGGGEAVDVILDTTNVEPGTYFLYTTNLNFLSNNTEDFGGIMTEIVIN
jgi:FtsP/CotA-like multicopper oxidase with cupredoxin domain